MSYSKECAQFTLDCGVFSPYGGNAAVVNQYGSCNVGKSSCVWNQIPLQSILGHMYGKYEKFNFICISYY